MTNRFSRHRTKAKWVKFNEAQATELQRLADAEGTDVSALVRRATYNEFPAIAKLGERDSQEEGSLSVTA